MTPSDWSLALTFCLVLSVGWSMLVFVACRLAENLLPAAEERHFLWWVGLVAAAAPLGALAVSVLLGPSPGAPGPAPFFGSVLGSGVAPADTGTAAAAGGGVLPLMLGTLRVAAPFAVAVYAIGLLWHGLSVLHSRRRLQRFLTACRSLDDGELEGAVAGWAAQLGLGNVPPILVTPEPCSPFSTHIRRPVLVLPEDLLRRCPPEQTALVCAHELAHLARHDLLFMRVQNILRTLLWFNPVAGLIIRRLDTTRETACDDLVLGQAREARRAYAEAFLSTLRISSRLPAHGIPFIHPHRKEHEMRLANIMRRRSAASRKLRLGFASLALAAMAVPMAGAQAELAKSLAEEAPQFAGAIVASNGAHLTSPYGPRILKGKENFHHGVDIGAPFGTPVKSPGNGRVLIASGDHKGYGKRIEIDYGGGWKMIFSQLSSYDVAEGDSVAAGQQIGSVGMSGIRATGPHLHLEILHNGKFVDPATVLDLPAPRTKAKTSAIN